MRKIQSSLKLLFVAGAIVLFASCQKNDELLPGATQANAVVKDVKASSVNTFNSPTQPIGNGIARAWVSETKDGIPVSVGVTLSEKALQDLPAEPAEFIFILPENKGTDFYKLVQLDWNPHGHFPPHVYDIPHFDVHFYIISNEDRLKIEADDNAQFANAPASKYVPPFYLQTPGGEPAMGAHWVDLLSPEFNGGVFTKTFIWGSYDGKFIFWEPMITRDYLLTNPNVTIPVRQPQAFQQNGYYPYQYRILYTLNPKEYNISLDLVYHEGE